MDWFTNNNTYHTLDHCMNGDSLWVGITVLLDLVIFSQYVLIAYFGYKHLKNYNSSIIIKTFIAFISIFLFCGICGYLSEVIRLHYPAYRLFALLKIILVIASQVFLIYSEKINFFSKLLVGHKRLREMEDEIIELQKISKKDGDENA